MGVVVMEVTARRRQQAGVSLIETLVVIAIISILIALQMPVFSKALRKAEETSVMLTRRDDRIGRMSLEANIARGRGEQLDADSIRQRCRAAFRQTLKSGIGEIIESEVLLAVSNDAEFRAYYHTLLDPASDFPLTGDLEAGLRLVDEFGNEFHLHPLETYSGPPVPVRWELISTDLSETTSGTLGSTVLYSDGHSRYVSYTAAFPVTRIVAEKTHAFLNPPDQ